MVKPLSKSKLIAFRQCPRRLWLEVHRPDLREDSGATQAAFATGHSVGDVARHLYDPARTGEMLDLKKLGMQGLMRRTQELLPQRRPLFEAGFTCQGARALADVLLPTGGVRSQRWRMVEVKSSTSVKDYHREDAAIQFHVAVEAGLRLEGIAVAVVDSSWVYPGSGRYAGLLVEEDLTAEVASRGAEVRGWIREAQTVAAQAAEPHRETGSHCTQPFECGFLAHCSADEPAVDAPVQWLPRVQTKSLKQHLADQAVRSMSDVPDTLLNERQCRVKACTLSGQPWFDAAGARKVLARHSLLATFLDFETIGPAVPTWAGTRPFEAIPFQFSAHQVDAQGRMAHNEFLDLSGNDPTHDFTISLLQACGDKGPVFVYSAGFEGRIIKALAQWHPEHKAELTALHARLVDLRPIAENHYYHPNQHGSWSIKAVLPAVAPDLSYDQLGGPQSGGEAQTAYAEAINPQTTPERREALRTGLLAYCRLDTYAMVRLWQVLAGRTDLSLPDAA
jgi:hypothetical protein